MIANQNAPYPFFSVCTMLTKMSSERLKLPRMQSHSKQNFPVISQTLHLKHNVVEDYDGTGEVSMLVVNRFLSRPQAYEKHGKEVHDMLDDFVRQNEDPNTSPNFLSDTMDDLTSLVYVLGKAKAQKKKSMVLILLKVFKILMRKQVNRIGLDDVGMRGIIAVLKDPFGLIIAKEVSNLVLNVCYEKENVLRVIDMDGVAPLVAFLSKNVEDLQAAALGALQSVCYQEMGRAFVRDSNSISTIVGLLISPNLKVQTRAAGTVHNLSPDGKCIRQIRISGGITPLISMLRSPEGAICGSAAAALQNMSRENVSRELINGGNAVPPLTDLLFGSDVQAQVCAAGALLNIMTPEDATEDDFESEERKSFRSLLSSSLALGMAYNSIFGDSQPFLSSAVATGAPPPAVQ